MKISIINNPQLYCEDESENFIGLFKKGDDINIKCIDGNKYEGSIDNIFPDSVELDTEEGYIKIKLDNIYNLEEI
jgi:hypothetical protein